MTCALRITAFDPDYPLNGRFLRDFDPITAGILRRWREDVRQGKASNVVTFMFNRAMQQEQRPEAAPRLQTVEDAQRWCTTLLNSLLSIFPVSPPVSGKP